MNRMQEALKLFDSIVNSRWFTKTVFVLIFTKMDLIEEWVRRVPVARYFPDCPDATPTVGPVQRYMEYLTDRFLSLAETDETAARIRVVQGSLISDGRDTILEILEASKDMVVKMAPKIVQANRVAGSKRPGVVGTG